MFSRWTLANIVVLLGWAMCAHATVLTFNDGAGGVVGADAYPNNLGYEAYFGIFQQYGDHVNAELMPCTVLNQLGQNKNVTFAYLQGSHGWTPDVNVAYNPGYPDSLQPRDSRFSYGDLHNDLQPIINRDIVIQFTSTKAGTAPRLYGFDLGRDQGSDYLEWDVQDAVGNILSQGGLTVYATNPDPNFSGVPVHYHIAVDANQCTADTLILNVYTGDWANNSIHFAIDNVDFGQGLPKSSICGDLQHPYPPYDFNHDCTVNFADFAEIAQHWLECTKPGAPCFYNP